MVPRLSALRHSVVSPFRTSIHPATPYHHHRTIPSLIRTRSMASEPRKFEFLVIAPDAPGMLEKRLEVRP